MHLDYGKDEKSIAKETKQPDNDLPLPTKSAKESIESTEILTDDTTVQDIPWSALKYTVMHPDFELQEFEVCLVFLTDLDFRNHYQKKKR